MDIRPATRPQINNVNLILANTEYSFPLSDNVRRFTIRARQAAPFKLSFQEGESGTNYLDIFSSEVWNEEEVYNGIILYMQSEVAGTIIEVLQWIQK